jgi:hypothetical protein
MRYIKKNVSEVLLITGKNIRLMALGYLSFISLPAYLSLDLMFWCFAPGAQDSPLALSQGLWQNLQQDNPQQPIHDIKDIFGLALINSLILTLVTAAPLCLVFPILWLSTTSLFVIAEVLASPSMRTYSDFGQR